MTHVIHQMMKMMIFNLIKQLFQKVPTLVNQLKEFLGFLMSSLLSIGLDQEDSGKATILQVPTWC